MRCSARLAFVAIPTLVLALGFARAAAADDHGDDAANATALPVDTWRGGRIDPAGDRDWFAFDAVQGADYVLSTSSSTLMDTTLTLIDADGSTLLAFDDDSGYSRASRITWRAPASATYYLVVAHFSASRGVGNYRVRAREFPSAGGGTTGGGSTGGGATTGGAITIAAPRVFDPKLDDGAALLPVEVHVPVAASVDLRVLDAAGGVVATLLQGYPASAGATITLSWNGRAQGTGATVDPGSYRLRAEARASGGALAPVERPLGIVRLGATAIEVGPEPGSGSEHDYLYHRAGGVPGAYSTVRASDPEWRIGAVSAADPGDLDRADGSPRPSPAPWTDVRTPPTSATNFSRPAVIDAGALARVTLRFGERAVSEWTGQAVPVGYPIAGVSIRALVNGAPALPTPAAPGAWASADLGVAAAAGIARGELDLEVRFEYREGNSWQPIPGAQRAKVRVYGVLGPARLAPWSAGGAGPGAPYLPWLAAIDVATGWVAGRAADQAEVVRIVSDGVFERSGLRYDRLAGAPAYATGPLDDLELDLTAFLDRAYGYTVNCSDCATLVATFANMLGADVDYAILGWNFTLNDVMAIGSTTFTSDLFGTGSRSAFSFHTVATRDGGLTVHDACLAVDGDAQPDRAPYAALRPRGMQFDHYRVQLAQQSFDVDGATRRPRLR